MQKIKHWIKLFLLAELCGTFCSVALAWLANYYLKNQIITAYSGAFGENIGFYSVLWYKEYQAQITSTKNPFWKSGSTLLLQFGFIEIIDSLVSRPYAMYICTELFPLNTGIILGKIVTDVIFYSLVISINTFIFKKNKLHRV